MTKIPDIVSTYLLFSHYRKEAKKRGVLDLSSGTWFYPTTLLPLGSFLRKERSMKYIAPKDPKVSSYINLVMKGKIQRNKTYIPCVALPKKREEANTVLESIFEMHNNGREYGGETVFKYLISELVDNIYEHSQFSQAFVIAQRYSQHGFVEICFFDDGITIPGSYKKQGKIFKDHEAIVAAVNGESTKSKERGFGLSTNLAILTKGLKGEIFIVSGSGAIYAKKGQQKLYKLQTPHILQGTLVSVRIPYPASKVDIYGFLN